MEVLTLLLFVGIVLVLGAVALFARSVKDATFDHADRLSLLPLDDDDETVARTPESDSAPKEP